jgi:hypothetical protein
MAVCLRLEAAPIAAFVATKGGGRDGPAPDAQREAGTQRRMTGPAILLRDAKRPQDAAENRRQPALPVRHG